MCYDECDARTRQLRGCIMRSQYCGRGTASARDGTRLLWCASGFRRTLLWCEIAELMDASVAFTPAWPHKFLDALRLVAIYRAERAERLRDGS